MKKNLNVGMVGYKFMGKAHSNGYKRLEMFFDMPVNVRMKAICGRDRDWVEKARASLGWEESETSWRALVEREDIDIINITAPSNVHHEIAMAAAENGKHIFCEKPLAITAGEARDILDAAEKHGVKHQVGFNYRFAPAVLLAKKLIDSGKLGKIYHFRGQYLQDFIIDPQFPLIWRLDKDIAGSGSHGDLGAHVIDMARFLVGDIDRVVGASKTFIKERPVVGRMEGLSAQASEAQGMGEVTVDDATSFLAEFKNGAMGMFEATRFAYGHKNAMSFEINGSKGSVSFELERFNELKYFNSEDEPELRGFRTINVTEPTHPYIDRWWPPGHIIGYEHTFVHELYEFVMSIARDGKASPSFYDGFKCCQILDAVEASVASEGWIRVDDI